MSSNRANSGQDNRAASTEELASCEQNFKETGNGLYIWMAIYRCVADSGMAQDLPQWLRTYLIESAIGLRFLADGLDATTRPKPEEFDNANAYLAAMGEWGRNRISFTKAAEIAPVLLKLKPDSARTEVRGKNNFMTFATDMKGVHMDRLHSAVGQVRAAKLAEGESADFDTNEARNVRRHAARGKKRFPHVRG